MKELFLEKIESLRLEGKEVSCVTIRREIPLTEIPSGKVMMDVLNEISLVEKRNGEVKIACAMGYGSRKAIMEIKVVSEGNLVELLEGENLDFALRAVDEIWNKVNGKLLRTINIIKARQNNWADKKA